MPSAPLRLRQSPKILDSHHHAPPSSAWYRRVAIGFVGLASLMVGTAWSIVAARAHIIVLSSPQDVEADFSLAVSRSPGAGEVRGDVITLEETVTDEFAVGGAASPSRLRGKVRISSTLYRPQPLIARTRIASASGAVFRLTSPVTVPGNGSVEASVAADAEGGDVLSAAGPFTIPGLNEETRKFFTVEVAEPFVLAADPLEQEVAQADIDRAISSLETVAEANLRSRLATQGQAAGFAAFSDAFSFETVETRSSPRLGTKAATFSVTVTRRGTGVFYDEAGLMAEAAARVADAVPFGQDLGRVLPESVKRSVASANGKTGEATLRVSAHGTATVSSQSAALQPDQLAGVSAGAAKRYVERVAGVASATVRIRPFWMPSLPTDAGRIQVDIR